MLRLCVLLTVLALLAVPFVASAQGRGKVRNQNGESSCTPEQAAAVARARAAGRAVPDGLDKKNCEATPPPPPAPPPPPPPSDDPPPSGIHAARGVAYEDVDGNGSHAPFAGEMGLAGWTVQLLWSGRIVATGTTDADGNYVFPNLGNGTAWAICVVPQAGYALTEAGNRLACGGNGATFSLTSSFMTWNLQNFGGMIQ